MGWINPATLKEIFLTEKALSFEQATIHKLTTNLLEDF